MDDHGLANELALLVGEARAVDAANARRRERHLRAAAAAGASLVGVLMDLADSAAMLTVCTTDPATIRGRVAMVALDAIGIEAPDGRLTYLPLRAVATVEQLGAPMAGEPSGNRPAGRCTRFAVLLAELATDRTRVGIRIGQQEIVGDLQAAGEDVLSVRTGDPPRTVYLATDQVSGVSFFASG